MSVLHYASYETSHNSKTLNYVKKNTLLDIIWGWRALPYSIFSDQGEVSI